ncbi:MAG TPA: (Fe-S)-binding protein [Acidimicrobiales bacterium]
MLTRYPIVLTAFAVAGVFAVFRIRRLVRAIAQGKPMRGRRNLGRAVVAELRDVLGQAKLLRWSLPGAAHALVFWGFIVLLLTIVEAIGDLFDRTFAIPGIGHLGAVGFLEDLFALLVLVGVAAFVAIRVASSTRRHGRQSRFSGSHSGAAWLILWMITAVIVTLLGYRGAQDVTGDFPYDRWAFVSHAVGHVLRPLGLGTNRVLETCLLDANLIVIAIFLVLVLNSKHSHIFLAPINIAFSRQPRALGALAEYPLIDIETMDEDTVFGVGTITDFSWKQLLDFATCTECGRCQSQCPAWATGKPLSPKLLVMAVRDEAIRFEGARKTGERPPLVPGIVDPDVLWACTTCGACVEECPVDIEHVDAIVDLRRFQVMMDSAMPPEAVSMLRNIETRGDPWGLGASKRSSWYEELDFAVRVVDGPVPDDVEYLYWTGCAGALDDRGRRTAQALARLLERAGISFAVLGPAESCTGDPARRIGDEYRFQQQAERNVELLNRVGAPKIVTSCPHCFNSLRNEYPAFGGDYEVVHHAQLLAELVKRDQLSPGRLGESITYHDPCYLSRHNRVIDEPRELLDSLVDGGLVEMERHGTQSFCCGAGGARMWMEESIGERINLERVSQAAATGASIVATACPFCSVMLDDGSKSVGGAEPLEVIDLALLLERSLGDNPRPKGVDVATYGRVEPSAGGES